MLLDWLVGTVGEDEEVIRASKVCRVVIAGNSIAKELQNRSYGQVARYLSRKVAIPSVEAVRNLDQFLAKLAKFVNIDLMPGEFDPVNHMLPQQPMNVRIFPNVGPMSTFHPVTNPYSATIDGVKFLGTSGQNIDDVYRFSSIENRLEILASTLSWGHMCPTAPDTLDCFPFYDRDPFIIEQSPHVYFCGNQPEFSSKRVNLGSGPKTTLVTVPSFSETGIFVLMNVKDLTVEPVILSTDFTASIGNDFDIAVNK
ncbi:unnamed protein product [Soboliphyme baturini]|uniref:DNA_pol_E_B domain-containing protein n=1 Tax=Soboliphyme baturini TaxID=241478 RepID=A0A183J9J4_9BILA|nr:unnamed protein product [Soboliphyme baturini]